MKIFSYGCLAPTENAEAVRKQVGAAHRYYNDLIEIECKRRDQFRSARRAVSPEYDALEARTAELEAQIDGLRTALKAAKASRHAPGAEPPAIDGADTRKQVAALCAEKKAVGELLRAEREKLASAVAPARAEFANRISTWCAAKGFSPLKSIALKDGRQRDTFAPRATEQANAAVLEEMLAEDGWPEFWRITARLDADTVECKKVLRKACGLPPGSYLLVEDAVDVACKTAQADPSFRRWDGCGRIGVQLASHNSAGEIMGGANQFLQIAVSDNVGRKAPGPNSQSSRPREKRGDWPKYGTARIRIGSDARKAPIWASFPIKMHRPLPEDSVVKRAWILVERDGLRTRYSLQVTVDAPESTTRCGTGAAALNLGWRTMPDGSMRVGFVVDEHGTIASGDTSPTAIRSDLRLPAELVRRMKYPRELQSIADTHFDVARDTLAAWAREHDEVIPEWMPEMILHIAQWRAHGRLARLVSKWRDEAFPGGIRETWARWRAHRLGAKLDLFCTQSELVEWLSANGEHDETRQLVLWLEWWRRKDAHLIRWAADQRRRARGWRKNLYRNWAARLAERYETMVVEKFDLRRIARRRAPEDENQDRGNQTARAIAAPSELREVIVEAFGKARVREVSPVGSTQTCTAGHVTKDVDARSDVMVWCPLCGRVEDQDERAATNDLRAHLDASGSVANEPEEPLEA